MPEHHEEEGKKLICLQTMEPDVIPSSKVLDDLKVTESEIEYKDLDFGPNFIKLKITDGVRELLTVIRDK